VDSLLKTNANAPNDQAKMRVPAVISAVGIKANKLFLSVRKANKITKDHADLPDGLVKKLPQHLHDPLFAIPHINGGYRIFTDAVTKKGEPVFVGVDADGDINTISPLHDEGGKTGTERMHQSVVDALARGEKIYARNTEALANARASSGESTFSPDQSRNSKTSGGAASGIRPLRRSPQPFAKIVYRENLVKTRGENFYQADTAPNFYSALSREVDGVNMKAANADGWKAQIKNWISTGKVKADEVEWTGLNDWLELQQGKVSKEQVAEFLRDNGVRVEEARNTEDGEGEDDGVAKYGDYTVGGYGRQSESNYREVLLTLPDKNSVSISEAIKAVEYLTFKRISAMQRLDYLTELGSDKLINAANEIRAASGGIEFRGRFYPAEQLPAGNIRVDAGLVDAGREAGLSGNELGAFSGRAQRLFSNSLKGVTENNPYEVVRDRRDEAVKELAAIESELERAKEKRKSLVGLRETIYESPHWQEENVLAHVRLTDRETSDGKKTLFVEELQSDWAQAKRGGKDVPDAPFIGTTDKWLTLAMKRIVKMAADEGYDRVAFARGEQNAEHYDLSNPVDNIHVEAVREAPGVHFVDINLRNGKRIPLEVEDGLVREAEGYPDLLGKPLDAVVGKDVAKRILEQELGTINNLSGLDLKVGGEGMNAFYDKIVPGVAKDVLKKLGAGGEVTRSELSKAGGGENVGFDITPAMREKAQQGMPLFQEGETIRGQYEQGKSLVTLFKEANASTFPHELLGHHFMSMIERFAHMEGSTEASRQEWRKSLRQKRRSPRKGKGFGRRVYVLTGTIPE
jgi:hypothetical protein